MNRVTLQIFFFFLFTWAFSQEVNAQQSYQYDFRNTLNETGGSGPALNALGSGSYLNESLPLSCLSRPVYNFTQGSGVQFDNGAAGSFLGSSYSLEMYFKFTDNTGFIRVIDFKNRTADSGLYVTSSLIQFYDELTVNTTVFASTDYAHLVLTRNGTSDLVSIYLNGSFVGSFTDSNDRALPNNDNVINFFQDDLVFGNENRPGNIALLKFYDYELSSGDVTANFAGLEQTSGTVAFSPDNLSACLATNVFNFTNESQNAGGVTYSWEFGDGNTAAGTNASHSYTAAGNYTVLLIADNGSGCTDSASVDVTVTDKPEITPSGSLDLCTGGSVTLTASPGATYLWSNGATTQAIIVNAAGTFSVTVDDGFGCIGTSDIVTVTLSSNIPGTINYMIGSTVACAGQSLPYEINVVNRALYYIWTLPTGATISGQSTFQTTQTTVTIDYDAGFVSSGVIEVRAYNGCGVRGPRTKTVSSSAPLTPAAIVGTTYACAGNTYTYSTTLRAGVDTYNWTAPVGAIITGQGSNQVDITFPGSFINGYVRVTAQNACGTSNQRSLYVRSKPQTPIAISGPTSALCGTTQTYSINAVNGATSYTWYAPAGSTVISGQGTTSVQISFNNGLNTGFVRVTADNPCGSSGIRRLAVSGGVVVTSDPVDYNVCTGDAATFSVVATGTSLIYQWRKDGVNLANGPFISGADAATLTIDPADITFAGLYDVIVRRACGSPDTSATATLFVDTNGNPTGPISGALVACDGDQGFAYSVASIPGAVSYVWSGNTGVTITSGQGTTGVTVDFGPTPDSGYEIYVQAQSSCALSDTTMLWVRTKVSTPNFTIAPSTACAGSTSVVYTVGAVEGADSYTWTAPAGATIVSGQGTASVTINFGLGFTSGQVCVSASNICFTSPLRCKDVTSTPNFPGNILGESTNVCNSVQPYSINPVFNATSYTWTVSPGATITSGQGTNAITVDFGASYTDGEVQVVSENACGTSAPKIRTVAAFTAKPDDINGDAAPCANSNGNVYSIDPLPGATSYTWTVPAGALITSGANTTSITVDFGSTAGNISARGENGCGLGYTKYLAISFSCRMDASAEEAGLVKLFPNPAKETINISFGKDISISTLVVFTDLSGRVVRSFETSNVSAEQVMPVDISEFVSGTYLITISNAEGNTYSRFIRE